MKKMRLHVWILLGVFLTTFILGSFLDLSISEAIYSKNNGFGLFVSVIGTLPGYACLAFVGGALFTLAIKRPYKIAIKVLFYIGAAVSFVLGTYYAGREFFGPNGFTNEKIVWVGYLIALPFMCGAGYLGYLATKDTDNKHIVILLVVLLVAIFMSLVPGVTLLKSIFHRPRFRTLSEPLFTEITFHHWWERCTNYKDLMTLYNVTSEEFKSFPSGHAGASLVFALTVSFLPLFNSKFEKLQLPLFYGGVAWTLLVCFARILVGAHFLSDVSMGSLITLIFMYIGHEVMIAIDKKFAKKEEAPVKEE